jgi:hypothetical protein
MTRSTLLLVLGAACGAGCTPTYTVHVNTFSEIKEPLSRTTPIYVSIDPNSRNPILADVIAAKTRALLEERGYTPTGKAEGAGYALTFRAGVNPTTVLDYAPVYRPYGGFYGFYGFYGGYYPFGYGYTAYVPYIETVYTHWLEMRLFTQEPNVKDKTRPIWIGEAVVGRSNADLRDSVNYLLIGLLDYFGMDTQRWVSIRLKQNDPRVEGLATVQ